MVFPVSRGVYLPISKGKTGPGWVVQPDLCSSAKYGLCEPIINYYPGGGLCAIIPGIRLSGGDLLRWGNPHCEFLIREKVGWGAYSTVWLAQDAQGRHFVLKALRSESSSVHNQEFKIMKDLARLTAAFLHEPENSQEQYLCLVMPPLGNSLYTTPDPVARSVESITTLIRTLWDQVRDSPPKVYDPCQRQVVLVRLYAGTHHGR